MEDLKGQALGAKDKALSVVASNPVAFAVGGVVLVVLILFFTLVFPILKAKNKTFPDVTQTYNSVSNATDTLRNYYCKASYNSCATGNFVSDWVNLSALSNAIKNGCRFLDFEVYDIEGEPHVAVSDSVKFTTKGCYNSIPLNKVFKTVKAEALTTLTSDPLFLNFRIKCDHSSVCDKVAVGLRDYFGAHLLGPRFSYSDNGKNLGETDMAKLRNKVVISADLSNKAILSSKLVEFVNMGAMGVFCKMLRYSELTQSPPSDFDNFVKQNLVVCIPDLVSSSANYDASKALDVGTQFVAMNFQTSDSNLDSYKTEFDGYGFILKPLNLRYYPTQVPDAPPLPPEQSYSTSVSAIKAGTYTTTVNVPNSG
jgi:hypothetical protein